MPWTGPRWPVWLRQIDRDKTLALGFVEMGLFERSYLLMGMEEALMAYLTHPEQMLDLLGALADYKIRLIERFHEVARLDILLYGDDWGNQRNLFLPPATWRRIVRPPTQRIYDCAKARGILVDQHCCGKIEDILGDMVEMGATCWNPCQPCNDLAGLKKKYGDRLAFYGGIDSQFVLGRPGVTCQEVRAEVRKRIDEMAAGGGYIAFPSHGVPYDKAILEAMEDEVPLLRPRLLRRGNRPAGVLSVMNRMRMRPVPADSRPPPALARGLHRPPTPCGDKIGRFGVETRRGCARITFQCGGPL